MKTTSCLALLTFLTLAFALPKDRQVSDASSLVHTTSDVSISPSAPAIGGWYLSMGICSVTGIMNCCCNDGNGYSCIMPLYYFGCKPGGPFDCTKDLINCEGNPSECGSLCCPDGAC